MKIKKNTISFLVCIALVVTAIYAPVSVNADSDILLDLDVETLTDKSGNNIELTELGTITTGDYFTNVNGEPTYYMTTAEVGDEKNSSTAGLIRIGDESIAGLTSYTVETWARYHTSTVWAKLFSQMNADNKRLNMYEMNPQITKFITLESERMQNVYSLSEVTDKWCHYVATFEPVMSGGEVIQVNIELYINGKRMGSGASITAADKLALLGTGNYFTIGGQISGTTGEFVNGFPGEFAAFRIYDSIKTADDAANMYNADKNNYTETTVSPSSITFEDGTQVSGAKNVSLEVPEIYVDLGSDTNMSTVSEDTIKLTDASDGLPISYSVTVDGTQAVISVQEALNKNKQYMVELTEGVLKNDSTAYGQFCAYFKTVRGAYADEGWTVEKSGDTITATLTAISDNDGGDFAQHVLSVYQICDGFVLPVYIEQAEGTVTSGTDLTLTADVSELPKGKYKAVSILRGTDLEIYENQTETIEFTIE